MGWEQRLKEMLLAGGALAAAACSSGSPEAAGSDASADVTLGGFDSNGCCNAASDPCCPYLNCEASITPMCSQEMACQAEGGMWSYSGCSTSQDAGWDDAASADAEGDAHD